MFTVIIAAALFCAVTPAFNQQLGVTDIYGGQGGDAFSDFQPPAGARIIEVRIRTGDRVDSIQMVYALADGRTVQGPRHGGSGGGLNSVRLDTDEYIIGISGRCGNSIDSVRIITNKRTSPLFGGRGGNREYRVEVPGGFQAVGFTGRAGNLVDAIGLTYAPTPVVRRRGFLSTPTPSAPARIEQTPIVGGRGGSGFADSEVPAGARIAEVHVRSGDLIDSVQIVYLLPDGRFQEGTRHGGSGGRDNIFRLDPDEFITGISGRYGSNIDSLRIHTNRRTSPLYGGSGGNRDYRLDVPRGGQAAGFAGRAGEFLDAIGLTYSRVINRR
jgi:hypothetical protein